MSLGRQLLSVLVMLVLASLIYYTVAIFSGSSEGAVDTTYVLFSLLAIPFGLAGLLVHAGLPALGLACLMIVPVHLMSKGAPGRAMLVAVLAAGAAMFLGGFVTMPEGSADQLGPVWPMALQMAGLTAVFWALKRFRGPRKGAADA